eukprot:m.179419 g.179419  ORF g.179419 m.179419 type:complete len:819 (-) comp14762_c0_seq1:75-2531(-)
MNTIAMSAPVSGRTEGIGAGAPEHAGAVPPPWWTVVVGEDESRRRLPSPIPPDAAEGIAWDDLRSPEPPKSPVGVHFDYTASSVPRSRPTSVTLPDLETTTDTASAATVQEDRAGGATGGTEPTVPASTVASDAPPAARPVKAPTTPHSSPKSTSLPRGFRGGAATFFNHLFFRRKGSGGQGSSRTEIDNPAKLAAAMVKHTADQASARSSPSADEDWEDHASDSLIGLGMQPWVQPSKLTKSTVSTGVPFERVEDVEWWDKNLPDPMEAVPKLSTIRKLAKRAREMSIPCVVRGKAWLHASGGAHYRLKNPIEYEKTCSALVREGGSAATYRNRALPDTPDCLNDDGCAKAERVLACLAYTHPQTRDYCPWLPLIVRSCLHWLDERDTYAVAASLIREPSPLISTRLGSWLMLDTFESLVRDHLPKEYATLCEHIGAEFPPPWELGHPLSGVVLEWMENVHFWPLTRIMDLFIIDGVDILHRLGLVVIQRWHQSVTYQPRQASGFARKAPSWYLPVSAARAIDAPDKFIADCMRFSISATAPRALPKMQARARAALSATGMVLAVGESAETKEDRLLAAETALVSGASAIIKTYEEWNALWRGFPVRFRIKPLQLNFTTDNDGYSLGTLFRLCDEECPTLLLVETTKRERFGAFLTHPWTERYRQSGSYFGNGDSFVFSLTPNVVLYNWVGLTSDSDDSDDEESSFGARGVAANGSDGGEEDNKDVPCLFMFANDRSLAVGGGGGGHAIQLDRALRDGCSNPCTTFGNPSLLQSGDMFTCARCEVWSFNPRDTSSPPIDGDACMAGGVANMMAGLSP